MISLDKIAKKTKVADSKETIKKPWEKKPPLDVSVESLKTFQKKTKPRFEIPKSGKDSLSSVSESFKFITDVLKM